jgi:hypothetical protein
MLAEVGSTLLGVIIEESIGKSGGGRGSDEISRGSESKPKIGRG